MRLRRFFSGVLAAALLCKCRKPDPYITLYGSQDPREP